MAHFIPIVSISPPSSLFNSGSIDRPITTRWQGERVMRMDTHTKEKKKGFLPPMCLRLKNPPEKSTRTIYDGDGEALGADDNPQPTS